MWHWRCNSCRESEIIDSLGKFKRCPFCGEKNWTMKQYIREEGEKDFRDVLMRDNERWSDSMGCTEVDLPRMQKLHPGSEWRQRPSGGYQMRIKNRHEKIRRMREAGFQEYD